MNVQLAEQAESEHFSWFMPLPNMLWNMTSDFIGACNCGLALAIATSKQVFIKDPLALVSQTPTLSESFVPSPLHESFSQIRYV
jgi:hypothetical protein